MTDKQAADLTAIEATVQRTAYVGRAIDPKLSLPTCRRAGSGAMWMLESLELPGTADDSSSSEEGYMAERLTLLPHQRAQASSTTGGMEVRNFAGISEKDARIDRELGVYATRSPG